MKQALVNYTMFQAGWFGCVIGAAQGHPWVGPVVILVALAVHLVMALRPSREVLLLVLCAVFGLAFDSLLLATGWISFPNGHWLPGAAPYWMVALWVGLGTTLNLSMAWLKGRPWLAFLLGATGGPLSYLGGQELGGMDILQPVPVLTALALGWGLTLPLLAALAARLDGFAPIAPPLLQPLAIAPATWREDRARGHV